jgi:hypothetical protein
VIVSVLMDEKQPASLRLAILNGHVRPIAPGVEFLIPASACTKRWRNAKQICGSRRRLRGEGLTYESTRTCVTLDHGQRHSVNVTVRAVNATRNGDGVALRRTMLRDESGNGDGRRNTPQRAR